MSTTPPQLSDHTDPETPPETPHADLEASPEPDPSAQSGSADPDAPVSVVPHDAGSRAVAAPVKIRTNRYGELEEHELVRLLDTIEDERARGRFRESIYISLFIWLAIAWVVFYGPRYLWHSPQLISPVDVMKQRQMVELNAPVLPHHAAAPPPKVDNRTLEKLRAAEPRRAPTPAPPAPEPAPAPAAAQPTPSNPAPALPQPAAPTPAIPRAPSPPVADAPAPQPTRPNFSTPGTASDDMRNAIRDAARNRNGGSGDVGGATGTPHGASVGGGVQVLSDLQGVDFSEYLRHVYNDVKRNWIPLLPEETQPPLLKQGETYIRFTILPNGQIGEMHLENSSHDVAIDKAAWGSIVSEGQFPPLPTKFHGPNLELRFHYIVNKAIQ